MTEKDPLIELKLPLSAVNYIMGVLGKQPFEQVASLVNAINLQAVPQLPPPETPPQEMVQ